MGKEAKGKIGFACSYTPLPLIDAAGFTPYRILPVGDWPDQAGQLLHDNLCPHVKRILDRAMVGDFPDLAGMVFMNSCDAMRRLAEPWGIVRPQDPIICLDLPVTCDELSVSFLAGELERFRDTLMAWQGKEIPTTEIQNSIYRYNEIFELLSTIRNHIRQGEISGGYAEMQQFYNRVGTEPAQEILADLKRTKEMIVPTPSPREGVPVFLFGNVMPDPEVFRLFENCGGRIVGDNFCTGSRIIGTVDTTDTEDVFTRIAGGLLYGSPCARTLDPLNPGKIAEATMEEAKKCGAVGVIGHTLKFCDPYLNRFPIIRNAFKADGVPLLLLEGDLSFRSMGQHQTRIEAFIEMLR